IPLRGRATNVALRDPLTRSVWRIEDAATLTSQRTGRAFLATDERDVPPGFGLYLTKNGTKLTDERPQIEVPPLLNHLSGGDVIAVSATGEQIKVMWRQNSRQNSVLLTERCDHYCLMCSQPPKQGNDDWLLENAFELIRLL